MNCEERDPCGMYKGKPIGASGQALLGPDGHPNSPVYGHLKLPHLN